MHIYEVLKRPVVTEKTMIATEKANKVSFEVDLRANKLQVKQAVEKAFKVSVVDINMLVMPAKTSKRGSTVRIRLPKWKKAVVTLAPGARIQLFEGV